MRRSLLLAALLVTAAAGREQVVDRMRFYAQWSDDYLYLGAVMEDIHVVGRQRQLNGPVWLDDDLEIFLQVLGPDGEPTRQLDDRCFWLGMSAAEGVAFQRGTPAGGGDWLGASPMSPGAPFRQSVKVIGTLNDRADADRGWTVEAALPWRALGLQRPAANDRWAFNLVRHLRGETDRRYSYLLMATPQAASRRPNLWGRIVFRGDETGAGWLEPNDAGTVVCARVGTARPLIDGRLEPGEWPALFGVDLELLPERLLALEPEVHEQAAETVLPLPDGCAFTPLQTPPRAPRGAYTGERLALATYRYDYQDDPAQPLAPTRGVRDGTGRVRLGVIPADGPGPWLNGLRVGWHAEHLQAAGAAHLDALLVRFDGDRESLRAYALTGLRSLCQAAGEVRRLGRPTPALAALIPLEALEREAGGNLDLTQPLAWERLWRMIRDFYRVVPPELRAEILDGERRALLVGLTRPAPELRVAPGFLAYCEAAARREFGLDLLWLGSVTWQRRGVPLDAPLSFDAGQEPLAVDAGRIATASVGPGWQTPGDNDHYRSRQGATTFREDARQLLRRQPRWLLLNSWNDYFSGDAIASTRTFGASAEAVAKVTVLQFDSPEQSPWIAKLRRFEPPAWLASGALVECPATVVNAGVSPWAWDAGVKLGYRWLTVEPEPVLKPDGSPELDRGGQPVKRFREIAVGPFRSPAMSPPDGREVTVNLPLAAVDGHGQPLPPGRYRLRLDAVADKPGWFGAGGDPTTDLLLDVIPPEQLPALAGSVLATTAPVRAESGGRTPLQVTVRNDGAAGWDASIRLAARFERVVSRGACQLEPEPEPVTGWVVLDSLIEAVNRDRRAVAERRQTVPELLETVAPGAVLELSTQLPLTGTDGRPLPPLTDPERRYRLSLTLLDGAGRPLPAARPYQRELDLLARDWSVAFQPPAAPPTLRGGESISLLVSVINRGQRTWPAEQTQLGASWHTWDGLPVELPVQLSPLPVDLDPGALARTPVTLQAPRRPGLYRVLLDVRHPGGVWSRSQPGTATGDLAVATILVVTGEAEPLDLRRFFDVTAVSRAGETPGAGFDGQGWSLPREFWPPGAGAGAEGVVPSGYLGPTDSASPGWQRQIAFWYGDPEAGATALSPAGQVVRCERGRYRRAHVLAAAVGEPAELRLTGRPAEPGGEPLPAVPQLVTGWGEPARFGELEGLFVPLRRGPAGERPDLPAWLHHVMVPLDPQMVIDAVILEPATGLRVFAITLERAAEQPPVGPPAPPGP